jgi:hypothetical protein
MAGALAPILWKRLDVPGHDAASLRLSPAGAVLSGMAVFYEDAPTALAYSIHCDATWRPVEARIRGWHGVEAVDLRLYRRAGDVWTLNDVPCPAVPGCVDLDLSFTPATNLLAIRRLALAPGQAAELRSAWLDWPAIRLTPLLQRYRRHSSTEYGYESDQPDGTRFRSELRVQPQGWVLEYPGLWQAEAPT